MYIHQPCFLPNIGTIDNGSNFVKMSAALLSSLGDDDIDQLGSDSWDEVLDVQLDHENENYGWRFPFFL